MLRDTLPKDISIAFSTGASLSPVRADPTQLHQVLTNVCVNARDAMPNGGVLTLAVESETIDEIYAGMFVDANPGPYIRIRVEDNGVGMTPDLIARIFDPFFTTKEVGRGTGLGLSTCHAIVQSHGGFIRVHSEPGRGTRLAIYLPADTTSDVIEEVEPDGEALPSGDGELILVVDDEEGIRLVTARTLERFGYRVITASNGAEALSLYARHLGQVAVVLTDMSMPIMDGPATVVALNSMDPSVRIVASSGLDEDGSVARLLSDGVKWFIPKPYTAERLLQVIRRALG